MRPPLGLAEGVYALMALPDTHVWLQPMTDDLSGMPAWRCGNIHGS